MPNSSSTITFAHMALSALIVTIATGGVLVWLLVIIKATQGQEPLEHEERKPGPWGLMDLVAGILLYVALFIGMVIVAQAVSGGQLISPNENDAKLNMTGALLDSAAKICAMAGMIGFITLRTGASLSDLGFSGKHLLSDIRLGVYAFAALAIPTYAIQLVLTQFIPSEHPLIKALQEEKGFAFLSIALFAAVVSAPLVEEFFFRVLLQGWFEKAFDPQNWKSPAFAQSLLLGDIRPELFDSALPGTIAQQARSERSLNEPILAELAAPESFTPFPSVGTGGGTLEAKAVGQPFFRMTDVLSILCSTLVFSLMHVFHGPDWIALLVLATGLGYLYRRTHRVTPGLTVHVLLNGVSMAALCVELYAT